MPADILNYTIGELLDHELAAAMAVKMQFAYTIIFHAAQADNVPPLAKEQIAAGLVGLEECGNILGQIVKRAGWDGKLVAEQAKKFKRMLERG